MTPRFSSRSDWPLLVNALSQSLAARRERGERVLDLTASNPMDVGLGAPARTLAALASHAAMSYAPEPFGLGSARTAVAGYYAAKGIEVDPAHVMLTASTSEAYSYLFSLLADPGDEVLVPVPSYPLFAYLADLSGVVLRPYALAYERGWEVDLDGLGRAITGRTRAIMVVSPNNPTGSFLGMSDLRAMRSWCDARGLALISDEVFADYGFGVDERRVVSIAGEREVLAFALGGLSKAAALPQLKLAWTVIAGPTEAVAAASRRLEMIADTFLSASTPVQIALPALLAGAGETRARIAERTSRNLARLVGAVGPRSPASVPRVEGGWYGVVRVPATRTADEWALAALARGVYVHPGHYYDFPREAYLVVSLLPRAAVFDEGVAGLMALIDEG